MCSTQAAVRLSRIIKLGTRTFTASPLPRIPTANRGDSQTLALPDGRVLGFAEFGHPNGFPLLFFHGFPASRLEAWGADEISRRRNIRLIALDRPGFGLSTFQAGRRITDWPADVLAFVEHANLKRFAVLGGSGGGPYALACAHKLPKKMMSAVGVMAGAPPWEAGAQNMSLVRRMISLAAIYSPGSFGLVTNLLMALARRAATSGPVTRRIDAWLESQQRKKEPSTNTDGGQQSNAETAAAGEDQLTTEESRERLLRIAFDGFAQGAQGFVQEARLLSVPDWGFKFEDVSYDPILIWHGTKDTDAPISMIRYMSKRLPHSALREFEGDTHFTMAEHLEQILMELIPAETSADGSMQA